MVLDGMLNIAAIAEAYLGERWRAAFNGSDNNDRPSVCYSANGGANDGMVGDLIRGIGKRTLRRDLTAEEAAFVLASEAEVIAPRPYQFQGANFLATRELS